jgi:thioester reductase-like protein
MASGTTNGETVMVTGASGFLSSCLVHGLLNRSYSIHVDVFYPSQ